MKKSLVLVLAMALGVTASAYAANPFSDVPAGHWAYDSISKLAAAGVIEGYGDDTFRGDRLMTRYEMAQIVAKATAKGANVDKLTAEFAEELDALGARVAALEKKSDNVQITGPLRYHYAHNKYKDPDGDKGSDYSSGLRSRIWFTGKVNNSWNYVGMLQNYQDLTDNVGNEGTDFQRAYLEGRLGGVHVVAGRQDFQLGDANLYDNRMDGIKISYGDKVKIGAYYGKPTDHDLANGMLNTEEFNYTTAKFTRFFGANIGYETGKLSLNAAYDKFKDPYVFQNGVKGNAIPTISDNGVWSIGANYNFGKAALGAIFLKSDMDVNIRDYSNKGLVVTASYGGAEAAKPGSWGLIGKYYNMGSGTFMAHTMNGCANDYILFGGFKGWSLEADVTVARNMVASLQYYDLKGKESDLTGKAKTLWGELTVTF